MELTQLYQFKAIAEYGTITEAAKQVHVSQPALSTMLRKLESELGVALFIRENNRLKLSDAGEVALAHVTEAIREIESMKSELRLMERAENEIKVRFCSKAVMWYFVPVFSQAYPDIRLETLPYAEDTADASILLHHEADALIGSREIGHPRIESAKFLEDSHFLSVPNDHPLAALEQEGITLREAAERFEIREIHYLKQQDDTFCNMFLEWCAKELPGLQLVIYTDFFLFSPLIQSKPVITTSTKLANRFRNDGDRRTVVPLLDEALGIRFYIHYLKEEKKRIKPLLQWKQYAG